MYRRGLVVEVCPGSRVKYSRAEQSRRDECVSEERGNRRKARKQQQGTRRAGRSGYQLINTNSNIVIAGISRLLLVLVPVLALALLSLCLGAVYLS